MQWRRNEALLTDGEGASGRQEVLEEASTKAVHKSLRTCLKAGVAFHHAVMEASDRLLVEQLFLNQTVRVLFATTTCVSPACCVCVCVCVWRPA